METELLAASQISRLARSSVVAFAAYLAGVAITYCAQFAIARIVGADSYGIYAYVMAWIPALAYFCALGFDVALLRFIPAYQAERAWHLLKGATQYAERRAMLVSAVTIAIGVSIIIVRLGILPPVLYQTFLIGIMVVPLWALLWIRCSIARAHGSVLAAVAPICVIRDGTLLAFIVVSHFILRLNIGAPFAMLATLVGSVMALGTVTLALNRVRPCELKHAVPTYAEATWRRTALPLMILAACEVLFNRTGVLVLGWIGDTKNAGIYSIVFSIAFVVTLPRTAINTLFAPTVAALFARGDLKMLQTIIIKSALWTLIAAALSGIALIVVAEPLLTWFGVEFTSGTLALQILVIGHVISASAGSQLQVMTMTGNEKNAAGLLVAMSAAHAMASVVFIKIFGITGAAVITSLAFVIWNIAMSFYLWRRLRIMPGVYSIFYSNHELYVSRNVTDASAKGEAAGRLAA